MDNSAAEQQSLPNVLCVKGCGFFGNPSSNGMCSKCFKESQHRQDEQSQLSPEAKLREGLATTSGYRLSSHAQQYLTSTPDRSAASPPTPGSPVSEAACSSVVGEDDTCRAVTSDPASPTEASASASSSPVSSSCADDSPKKSKKSRCAFEGCRARVGLLGFDCRCGLKFCSKHRYSDQHNCSFDYKTDGRSLLEKSNPAVVASKVGKL